MDDRYGTPGSPDEWRDIPGTNGFYQAGWNGQIRSWKNSRWPGMAKKPSVLAQYFKYRKSHGRKLYTKIRLDGETYEVLSALLVAMAWLPERPEGKFLYHRNGLVTDNRPDNLCWRTRQSIGKETGRKAGSRRVVRIGADNEVIEYYPSAREAGKATHWSYQSVLDRCNGKVKKERLPDGSYFRWDE